MKLRKIDRIIVERFPKDVQKWLGDLISPINDFITDVYVALTKNLTFEDNINSQIKTLTFSGNEDLSIRNKLGKKPIGVLLLKINILGTDPAEITDATTIDWVYEDDFIKIRNISNLVAGTKYTATFLII